MLKQLSGVDAGFLYMETANSFGHVNSLSVYERPSPDYEPYEAFKAQLEPLLGEVDPFRRRLLDVPLGLDHPYWFLDPDFDLDFHLRHMALPAPGDDEQLALQVSRIIGRPMDRSKPLWEVYVIEGLAGGDFAVLTKIHHATIDGAAGTELMTMLLDADPDHRPERTSDEPWTTDLMPSGGELISRALVNFIRRPQRLASLQLRTLREVAALTRNQGLSRVLELVRPRKSETRELSGSTDEPDRPPLLPTIAAPRTPFNRPITPHRRFAFRSVPLDDVKDIKNALGATLNDVVMAVCAGAVRRWLQTHDALPDKRLVAGIPVSTRTGAEEDRWTNRVSMLTADLPTDLEDPVARVRAVHETMVAAKSRFDMLPADMLVDIAGLAPAALATRAMRLGSRLRITDRMNPPINLIISNVPGPRQPLYLGGARLKHFYPVSTVVDGQGLNMTVQSYLGTLDFGLVSCRELVPDLWDLVDLCVDEVNRLKVACGLTAAPAAPAKSAKSAKPAKSAKSAKSPAPAKSAKSATSAAPARSAAPAMRSAATPTPAKKATKRAAATKKAAPAKKASGSRKAAPAKAKKAATKS